jgi:hypothetical protein
VAAEKTRVRVGGFFFTESHLAGERKKYAQINTQHRCMA